MMFIISMKRHLTILFLEKSLEIRGDEEESEVEDMPFDEADQQ